MCKSKTEYSDILNEVDLLSLRKKDGIINSSNMILPEDKTVYYLSESGNNNNDGLTEKTPWKSIEKVNSVGKALENSVICFKRGDTFRGNIVLQSNIIYTAYGKGEKPKLIGSPENGACPEKWVLVDGTENIWKYKTPLNDVGTVIFNDGEEIADKLTPEIVEYTDNDGVKYEFNQTYTNLRDMQFICIFDEEQIIKNKIFKQNAGVLYLRCDKGNPGDIYNSIEFNTYGYIFNGAAYYEGCNTDITIDNICLMYTGGHAIGCSSANNLIVKNCEIGWIGGSVMTYYKNAKNQIFYRAGRYGNGVEVTGFCNGYTVKNCYIHDIYDAGITHQNGKQLYSENREYKNILYKGNLVERCCYSVEYFAHYSTDGVHNVKMNNIEISENIMRFSGVGICEQRVSENFMGDTDDGLLGFNMASHINGWYGAENHAENFIIKNNIFDRAVPNNGKRKPSGILIIAAKDNESLPQLSNNTYIHYYGKNFAYFGPNTDMFSWDCQVDELTERYVLECLGDKTGIIYMLKG